MAIFIVILGTLFALNVPADIAGAFKPIIQGGIMISSWGLGTALFFEKI